jgi:DNA-binding transcriptional ArsR family regulator
MHHNHPARLENHSERLPLREHLPMPGNKSSQRRRSNPQPEVNGDQALYDRQVRICKALANPTRLRILDLLAKRPHTVSGLQKELGIPLANVSVQLSTLRAAGVVSTQKKGKEVHCFLAMPEVRQACHFIREVLKAQVRNAQKLPI